MSDKEKQKEISSSKKVSNFLEESKIHKRDFAQMIGVTLSYVYNLIDPLNPFSTRTTTLERIATVMDILPEEFPEYAIPSDPVPLNKNLETIKDYIKKKGISTAEFLMKFDRKKRPYLVDMLRGVKPLYINFGELKKTGEILNIPKNSVFNLWKEILVDYLKDGGFDIEENKELIEAMFSSAKEIIMKKL